MLLGQQTADGISVPDLSMSFQLISDQLMLISIRGGHKVLKLIMTSVSPLLDLNLNPNLNMRMISMRQVSQSGVSEEMIFWGWRCTLSSMGHLSHSASVHSVDANGVIKGRESHTVNTLSH